MGQSERASGHTDGGSCDKPEVTVVKALVAAVMAAVAAGYIVAARAAAKGLLAYLEALPDATGKGPK